MATSRHSSHTTRVGDRGPRYFILFISIMLLFFMLFPRYFNNVGHDISVTGIFLLRKFHLGKFHQENSSYGKFLLWKIHPMENSSYGKFLLWKIPPMENSSHGKFLLWKIPPMENSTYGKFHLWKSPYGKFHLWKIPPTENSSHGKFLLWKFPPPIFIVNF